MGRSCRPHGLFELDDDFRNYRPLRYFPPLPVSLTSTFDLELYAYISQVEEGILYESTQ